MARNMKWQVNRPINRSNISSDKNPEYILHEKSVNCNGNKKNCTEGNKTFSLEENEGFSVWKTYKPTLEKEEPMDIEEKEMNWSSHQNRYILQPEEPMDIDESGINLPSYHYFNSAAPRNDSTFYNVEIPIEIDRNEITSFPNQYSEMNQINESEKEKPTLDLEEEYKYAFESETDWLEFCARENIEIKDSNSSTDNIANFLEEPDLSQEETLTIDSELQQWIFENVD
ncbi:hypothetical protein TNCT_86271 [Trichonephila clavata]|uniref:Uncharacterized protein n=1 Tax=Trichonephila clavata TaxID=2740835 RepID=A0A8X6F000_TRICU|nr:hypothetical protein TNCT_86271 [Trichonephila clavata]